MSKSHSDRIPEKKLKDEFRFTLHLVMFERTLKSFFTQNIPMRYKCYKFPLKQWEIMSVCLSVSFAMLNFITVCQRSCGKVLFSVVSVCMSVHKRAHVIITHDALLRTPPTIEAHKVGASWRYASYWNAFLLKYCNGCFISTLDS